MIEMGKVLYEAFCVSVLEAATDSVRPIWVS